MEDKRITSTIPQEHDAARMESIIKKLRKENDEHYARTGKRKKHLTVTFGCQMNSVGCFFISH